MTPDEDLIRARIRRYMEDRRAFQAETVALIEADGFVNEGTPWPTEQRIDERSRRWEACKAPHVASKHESGTLVLGGDAVAWERTSITSINVKGRRAIVMTEELPPWFATELGPDTFRYRLRRENGEWRIASRDQRSPLPPTTWIRHLL